MSTPLRKLAEEHAAGRLDDAEYRRQRRTLLHQLAGRAGGPATSGATGGVFPSATARARLVRIGVAWLAFALIALSLQWHARQAALLEPLERSAMTIIEDPGWGSVAFTRLAAAWNALPADQRDRARASSWYPALIDALALRMRQLDERVLALDGDALAPLIRLDRLVSELKTPPA